MLGFIPIVGPFEFVLHSNCCYRMADPPSPPEVVVEVVGWDRIDPLLELPLFHSTAEDSFGGSLYIFGEPALFWLEGWGGLHKVSPGIRRSTNTRGPGVGKIQELPVPVLRRGLGSYDLVRVRRGSTVCVAGNPRRVARPRRGAEGRVRSGNGFVAPNCLPGAG